MKKEELERLLERVQNGNLEVEQALQQVREAQRLASQIPQRPAFEAANRRWTRTYHYDETLLRDHKVGGKPVIIGVAHASMAIDAYFALYERERCGRIRNLSFISPIKVDPAQPVIVEMKLEKDSYEAAGFETVYGDLSSDDRPLTAKGELLVGQASNRVLDLAGLQASAELYEQLDRIYEINQTVELGPSFKTIQRVYKGQDYILVRAELTGESASEESESSIHPLLLNSAFLSVVPLLNKATGWDGYLPFAVKDVLFRKTERLDQCWIHIHHLKESDEMIVFDAELIENTGIVVAELTECSIKRLRLSAIPREETATNDSADGGIEALEEPIIGYLVRQVETVTDGRLKSCSITANLMELGLNSAQLIALTGVIGREIGSELYPTLFFEYPSIEELASYFGKEHREAFQKLLGTTSAPIAEAKPKTHSSTAGQITGNEVDHEDIAVIGMDALFAESSDIEMFWENIVSRKDLIKEIPPDHWDFRPWFDEDRRAKDKTYCKWGSFIDDVDKFDAEFFNISPREAEWMDPQIRLLLQSVYATAEDAGVVKQLGGSSTGVFVGVCVHDYADRIAEMNLPVDPHMGTGNAQTVVANRVSFIFDLKGPSMAIDTACSSSLFALHTACRSLQNGECKMAFVGGVNLLLSSWHYRYFSSIGALSPTGRCHTFDAAADGYVPGEAIASMLLKPLSQAKKDGNRIYAVIKGSAALHGGHTPSLTAPSIEGEEHVIAKAWEDAGIEPESIGYIEAHGTGTALGDPIEISSLKKAFERFTDKKQFCAVGSVKSNIGHTEGAAGIAGVIKVIQQMRHREIPAMPKLNQINPYIQLEDSALYINRENQYWDKRDGLPRRAGVSSFGFSGSYAHVVIEEYVEEASAALVIGTPYALIWSAKNEEQLREQVRQFVEWMSKSKNSEAELAQIAYTLQTGRDEHEERLAVAVESVEELHYKLSAYLDGRQGIPLLYKGSVGSGSRGSKPEILEHEEISKVLERWVQGGVYDWNRRYEALKPRPISLPTYPFAKERYWIPDMRCTQTAAGADPLHPLLHRNTSDFTLQRFSSRFEGTEFYLEDHQVEGRRILPGVAYLEMARAAAVLSIGKLLPEVSVRLQQVVWAQPILAGDEPVHAHITLKPSDNGTIDYRIYTGAPEEQAGENVHSQGTVLVVEAAEPPVLDYHEIRKQCSRRQLSTEQCYEAFEGMGIHYGPSHRSVSVIYIGDGQLLAQLSMPSLIAETRDDFVLHPSMMDGALQACIGLAAVEYGQAPLAMPFALTSLEVFRGCTASMWAYIRSVTEEGNGKDRDLTFDIDLCDDQGRVCIRMTGLVTRALTAKRELALQACSAESRTAVQLRPVLIKAAASILGVKEDEIDPDAEMEEYGMDPIKLNEWAHQLFEACQLEIRPSELPAFKTMTINTIAEYLSGCGGVSRILDGDEETAQEKAKVSEAIDQMNDMNRTLCRMLWAYFCETGWVASLSAFGGYIPSETELLSSYRRWFQESVAMLVRSGYLMPEANGVYAPAQEPVTLGQAWVEWEANKNKWLDHDDVSAQASLVEATMRALSEILSDGVRPTDVMFPGSSAALVEGIYKNNRVADFYNDLLADTAADYVRERIALDPNAEMRILEIGAGSGGTSEAVLRRLKPYEAHIIDFSYTDVSKSFLLHAEQKYGKEYPYLSFHLCDVEQALEGQGIAKGSFDIVIAANVLHATRDMKKTLYHVKSALCANGLLLLNELTGNTVFNHVTFGLLEGWWRYEDPELRIPGCPGLHVPVWQSLLARTGFHGFMIPSDGRLSWDQHIIAALSDGILDQPKRFAAGERHERLHDLTNTDRSGEHMEEQWIEDYVKKTIREYVAQALKMDEKRIQDEKSFSEYGVDSIVAVSLVNSLNHHFGLILKTTVLFDYNNVKRLCAFLIKEHTDQITVLLKRSEPTAGREEEGARALQASAKQFVQSGLSMPALNNRFRSQPAGSPASAVSERQSAPLPVEKPTYHHVVIERPGGVDSLRISQSGVPEMRSDEVRIAVRAFALNFGDLLCLKGLYPTMPAYPFTPGFEASGVVVASGADVSTVRTGDEVIVALGASFGGHSTMITCREDQLFKKPDYLTFEQACTIPAAAMTMINAFRKADLKKGEKILIHTAASGTGLIAVQLARHYGAEIYVTAGSNRKLEFLETLGVNYRINHRETDFEEEIDRLTGGKGIDVIINTLPGDAIQKGINCLAPGGRYIELAMTALKTAKTIDLSALDENQTFYSINSRKLANENPAELRGYVEEMLALVEAGTISPVIDGVIPFERVADAYRSIEDRTAIGKLVVTVTEPYRYQEATALVKRLDNVELPRAPHSGEQGREPEPIAVIGMSGRFAKSETLEEFWANLANGTDLIEEASRWDLSPYKAGKNSFCSKGSYVDAIDRFDPVFFNISGYEANYMDPQQRLFLEEAWKALEDAGYAGAGMDGRKCGVFVGSSGSDYARLMGKQAPAPAFWGNAGSVIPARIAYYLNLHGPAVTIDTACSSSLVAVHMACQSLRAGETELALAGGVFIQSTPSFYESANQAGMLSASGRCYTFDERADGFVPGEGVGTVVLKRLRDAQADGDYIYGVIIGSGINQDGTTNGLTAPSALSQERLERDVYDSFGIDPESIQLVEAHGTGTRLGDPIEYQALTNAFRHYTERREYCAIGSVKTNMGHAAAAAGIAGLLKVMLALKYKQLPPSLHFSNGNPGIDFKESPFYVNTELRSWEAEAGSRRRAAVSSFGFSGTNAHLVVEEAPAIDRKSVKRQGFLIVLSACTQEQLRRQAEQLLDYVLANAGADCGSISFTLLTGRKHFHHRLALVVRDTRELASLLSSWIGSEATPRIFQSELDANGARQQLALKRYGNQCIRELQHADGAADYMERLSSIAELYVQGYELDYHELFAKGRNFKIPLPTYPFADERYWVPEVKPHADAQIESDATKQAVLHPLVQRNTSDFQDMKYSSTFTGEEFFIRDHVVNGEPVMPGVAYLEMAQAAIRMMAGGERESSLGIRLKRVVWARPMIVAAKPLDVRIGVKREQNGDVSYRITSQIEKESVLHCQGAGELFEMRERPVVLLEALKTTLTQKRSVQSCYEAFERMGIRYGSGQRGLDEVYTGPEGVLAKLLLPASVQSTKDRYTMHPSMMDSALQAAVVFMDRTEENKMKLPFAIDELELFDSCTTVMWAWLRPTRGEAADGYIHRLDIDLCDEQGNVCVAIKGFSSRLTDRNTTDNEMSSNTDYASGKSDQTLSDLLTYVWDKAKVETSDVQPPNRTVIIAEEESAAVRENQHEWPVAPSIILKASDTIEEMAHKLKACGDFEHLLWIAAREPVGAAASDAPIEEQEKGVLHLFRLVKALLALGYGSKRIALSFITQQAVSVQRDDAVHSSAASVHGLAGAIAKEYPLWAIRVVDLEAGGSLSFDQLFRLPADPEGHVWAYRDNRWYRQRILPVTTAVPIPKQSLYRQGGVYVVIGGAGGIGEAWTEYMIRQYRGRIVWIGRKSLDETIQLKIDRLGAAYGIEPWYISADAKDKQSLQRSVDEVKSRYGAIHGVIHSAIVLLDQSLANMDEARFRAALSAKVDISTRMGQVFATEQLDFMLFFSSINSYTKPAGQSNYASGCTFKDAFAHRLGKELPFPVKVMNWGYWGSVGVVASEEYRKKMASLGVASIEPDEAMAALELLLVGPLEQLVMLKMTKPVPLAGLLHDERLVMQADRSSLLPGIRNRMQEADDSRLGRIQSDMGHPMALLDAAICKLMWAIYRESGWLSSVEDGASGMLPAYYRWHQETIAAFERAGFIRREDGTLRILDTRSLDLDGEWRQWYQMRSEWKSNGNMNTQAELAEKTLHALQRILVGELPATDVIFPNGSFGLVESVYKNNLMADFFNEALADTAVAYVQERLALDKSAKIRILEIGAGTGGTSAVVLKRLEPYQSHMADYLYTDLSKAFLIHGKQVYGAQAPYLSCKMVDIERPLAEQGIEEGSFDLVIATNVLHATARISRTLRHAKAALRPGGLLLTNEIHANRLFMHVTFGLLEGWWLHEDAEVRIPGSPVLTTEMWQRLMAEEGFRSIFYPARKGHFLGAAVIAAESDGVYRQYLSGCASVPSDFKGQEPLPISPSTSGTNGTNGAGDVSDRALGSFIQTVIRTAVADALQIDAGRIQDDRSFSDYGVDSIIAVNLINIINEHCETQLQTTIIFDYNSVERLSDWLLREHRQELLSKYRQQDKNAAQSPPQVMAEERAPASGASEDGYRAAEDAATFELAEKSQKPRVRHHIVVERPGGIDELQLKQSAVPLLTEHDVLVEVRAFSLNFGDLLCAKGLYPVMPPFPFTPGFEASGVVIDTGKAVTSVRRGDQVVVIGGENIGAQSTYIVCSEQSLLPKPDFLSFEEACSLPAVGLTMMDAFRKAAVKPGDKVLVQTAAGGIGLMAVQLARHYGAEIYATAGSKEKLDYLAGIGVSKLINYREDDFEQELKRLTDGQGVQIVVNTLSGDAMSKGFRCLAPGGRYIELALTALKSARSIDLSLLNENRAFSSVDLRALSAEQPAAIQAYWDELTALIRQGVIRPTIGGVYALSDFKEAYRQLENRKNIGKIVVRIPGGDYLSEPEASSSAMENASMLQAPTPLEPVAIVGISGRFARSDSVKELWSHLEAGTDLVEEVTRWELRGSGPDPEGVKSCRHGSFLSSIDCFDPLFFNITGVEADYMDPQQRIFLEESWKALEDAGYAGPGEHTRRCGVYVGSCGSDYARLFGDEAPAQAFWGNAGSVIPARIAYYLNLQGPAVTVDTACSSSLVAIHLACQSLWTRETDMALAGGVFIQSTPEFYTVSNRASMLSPTGRCHAFDERADGFVPGEGAGAIVLKRLKDALADGDHIYGVIRGSGINQDGTTNGITAPSANSQERLLRHVYDTFCINPRHIQLVEAHGTGTKLGDPIEFQALTRAFRHYTDDKRYCAVGSIKSNLGHPAAAAGIAGLLKVILSLRHKKLPPSLHFEKGNTSIAFENSPFYVNTELRDWTLGAGTKRMAAISSFGFSGTNAHLVLEEAPQPVRRPEARSAYLFVLSGRTAVQLRQQIERLAAHCRYSPQLDCAAVSFTLLAGRKHLKHRFACVAASQHELLERLGEWLDNGHAQDVVQAELQPAGVRDEEERRIDEVNQSIQAYRDNVDGLAREHLLACAELFVHGYPLDLRKLFLEGEQQRIPLPTYPFAKESHWVKKAEQRKEAKTDEDGFSDLLDQFLDETITLETAVQKAERILSSLS